MRATLIVWLIGVVPSAIVFRRWDRNHHADIEHPEVYLWNALAWFLLLPWGWLTYGRHKHG